MTDETVRAQWMALIKKECGTVFVECAEMLEQVAALPETQTLTGPDALRQVAAALRAHAVQVPPVEFDLYLELGALIGRATRAGVSVVPGGR